MRSSICLLLAIGIASAQTTNYVHDEAGRLIRATYPNGKTINYTYDKAGNLLRRLVTTAVAGPTPTAPAAGVVNAASFLAGPVAPGEIVTLFGTGIGPSTLAGAVLTRLGFLDNFVGETTVLFDGVPSPVVYVQAGQTAVIVPYSVAGKTSTQMVVQYQGRASAPATLAVAAAVPAIFSANNSGKGNGAIVNQDNSFNSPGTPADKNSIIVLFATGEGQTSPPGVDGRIASAVFPKPAQNVTLKIGGIDAEILYAGAAPNFTAGLLQLNARIPASAPSGNVPVVLTVGTASSQPELTVAVR